jgi:hypothetical protein
MLKKCALSSELSRPLPLARSSNESLLICPSHDSADRLCGHAQLPSTKYRPPYVGSYPASTVPQSVLPVRNANNPKPSHRRPSRVVLGQVGTGSRRVASCFQRCLVEKQIFRRSPIIVRSPCTIHEQLSKGGGGIVCKGGFAIFGRTLGPNIAFPARLRAGRQLPHSVR